MSPCDHHVSRHRYHQLRGSRISAATEPLSVVADRESRLCLTTAETDTSLHSTGALKAVGNVRLPTYGAGRERRDFVHQPPVRTSAWYPRGHRMPPAPPLLDTGTCALDQTTAVRAHAHATYSKHFRAAYGHHCARYGALHHSSTTESSATRKATPGDTGFPITVTCLAGLNHSHHHAILPFSTDSQLTPTCAGTRPERSQEAQSRSRRPFTRAKLYGMAARSVNISDSMVPCDKPYPHTPSSHRRPAGICTVSGLLTAERPPNPAFPDRPVNAMPRPRLQICRTASPRDPLTTSIAKSTSCDPAQLPSQYTFHPAGTLHFSFLCYHAIGRAANFSLIPDLATTLAGWDTGITPPTGIAL